MTPHITLAKVKVKLDLWKDADLRIAEVEDAREWLIGLQDVS